MITVIGINEEKFNGTYRYEMYFRDNRGFKYKISMYSDTCYGIRDLYMCASIPKMSPQEYNSLPEQIIEQDAQSVAYPTGDATKALER